MYAVNGLGSAPTGVQQVHVDNMPDLSMVNTNLAQVASYELTSPQLPVSLDNVGVDNVPTSLENIILPAGQKLPVEVHGMVNTDIKAVNGWLITSPTVPISVNGYDLRSDNGGNLLPIPVNLAMISNSNLQSSTVPVNITEVGNYSTSDGQLPVNMKTIRGLIPSVIKLPDSSGSGELTGALLATTQLQPTFNRVEALTTPDGVWGAPQAQLSADHTSCKLKITA